MTETRRSFLAIMAVSAAALRAGSAGAHVDKKNWRLPQKNSFRVVENEWITMKDGVRLGARLWIPTSADHEPVPVVLEYIPYRKRDLERPRDDGWANQFAQYGFAFARVDIRGSGDSEGVLVDEYLQQEQDDGVEIIAWLARQPWCSGAVGMRGISWGGFACFQVAAQHPPALKAIMPQCATDNRYTDDAHYVGGALTLDMYDWGTEFKNVMVASPDPDITGPRWREMWLERLNATPPILATWLSHQRFDSYWQHGSIATNYASIQIPTYVVGGQIDSYRDFLPRTLSNLTVPRKGLMGPWGHKYPQIADPGPGLDWVTEEVRWWTQWLKGVDTGIMAEPMFRAYMEYQTASEVWPHDTPGRWVSEARWPPKKANELKFHLNADGGLAAASGPEKVVLLKSQETLGLTKREWFPWNMSIDLPPDQTPDDARSVCFESAPLAQDLEVLGNPRLEVRLSSSQRVAKLVARINEVTPDGKSWSVSYGVLNLTHRSGHENPSALEPGRSYDIDLSCYFTAHRFKKGSRIRVALSESLWPMLWPSPLPVELSIVTGVSTFTLPTRRIDSPDAPMTIEMLTERIKKDDQSDSQYEITQMGPDVHGRVTLHKRLRDLPETLKDIGTTVSGGSDWFLSIQEGDPNSCVWQLEWWSSLARGDWVTRTRSTVELSSTAEEFRVKESMTAWEGEKQVFHKSWDQKIPRDLL
jgi:putative CocE/NonD family hydrolase